MTEKTNQEKQYYIKPGGKQKKKKLIIEICVAH